jgi:hypothetical protein
MSPTEPYGIGIGGAGRLIRYEVTVGSDVAEDSSFRSTARVKICCTAGNASQSALQGCYIKLSLGVFGVRLMLRMVGY